MTATCTDLFCGAGGSSTGAVAAGMTIAVAANHWQTAIEVHQIHHPDARHDVADISAADPRRYPTTDVLLASPECTNHSQAKGVSRKKQDANLFAQDFDPRAERSRATMWDVVRFAEQIRYTAVVVENVVEATKWVFWPQWLSAMTEGLGYEHRILSHNSMHHGVPQSRDRIYIVFTRPGLNVNLEMEHTAWCERCATVTTCRQAWKNGRTVGRYRTQWVWNCTACHRTVEPAVRPAADIIDWSLPTPKIGERTRPLADKTRQRIYAGLKRHGWAPVVTSGAGNGFERTPGDRARRVYHDPLPTQTCSQTHAMATPPESMIVPLRNNGNPYTIDEPLGAVTAGGNHHGLLMRNNNNAGDMGAMSTPVTEPARTMTTTASQSLILPYYGQSKAHPVTQPIGTQTTRDTHALVKVENVDAVIDECGFRMLEPHEIAAAMAFPEGYIPVELPKKDRVKLAGNAVTPPVMQWICGRILQALEEP